MNVSESYIDFDCGSIYTKHFSNGSDLVLYLGTGNNIGARALWDFQLPNGKTHAEILCESGIDVVVFDVIGYGSALGFKGGWDYDRKYNSKQIIKVIDHYRQSYKKNVLFGYCSTTAQTIIAAEQTGWLDKLIIHSASCLEWMKPPLSEANMSKIKFWFGEELNDYDKSVLTNFSESAGQRMLDGSWSFICSVDRMLYGRYNKMAEKLIPQSNKLPNYREAMYDIVNTFTHRLNDGWWVAPLGMVEDFPRYYHVNFERGYDHSSPNIPGIITMNGEYDFEASFGYPKFKELFSPKIEKEIVLENATHFSVWENTYQNTLDHIVSTCKKVLDEK
jgi:hypothetical protein